jgi:hypothetical protein
VRVVAAIQQRKVLSLVHWLLGPTPISFRSSTANGNKPQNPEEPFFDRTQIQQELVDSVCENGHKETSDGIDYKVVCCRLIISIDLIGVVDKTDHDD